MFRRLAPTTRRILMFSAATTAPLIYKKNHSTAQRPIAYLPLRSISQAACEPSSSFHAIFTIPNTLTRLHYPASFKSKKALADFEDKLLYGTRRAAFNLRSFEQIQTELAHWENNFIDQKVAALSKLYLIILLYEYNPNQEKTLLTELENILTQHQQLLLEYTPEYLAWEFIEIALANKFHHKISQEFLKLYLAKAENTQIILRCIAHNSDPIDAINGMNYVTSILKINAEQLRDLNGCTVLHYANSTLIADHLLTAWPNLKSIPDNKGRTPIFYHRPLLPLELYKKHKVDLNTLDKNGNSVLVARDEHPGLINAGAKYVRRNIEYKGNLHLQLGSNGVLVFDEQSLPSINLQDEDKKTPLHYAIILNRIDAALDLIKHGANPWLRDRSGRHALHYALYSGHFDLINAILQLTDSVTDEELHAPDNLGLTNLVFAYYSGRSDIVHLYMSKFADKLSAFEHRIIKHIASNTSLTSEQISADESISAQQKLILLGILASIHASNIINATIIARASILPKLVPGLNDLPKFKPGQAYGIELELANVPELLLMPFHIATLFFNVVEKLDRSVHSSLLMHLHQREDEHKYIQVNEITSKIIDSQLKLQAMLKYIEILHDCGARVNSTTGFHIHVNINGPESIAKSVSIPNNTLEKNELLIVKQIIKNFARVEALLCSFMRNGNIFDGNCTYARPIDRLLDEFIAAPTLDELRKIPHGRNYSLNVVSLGAPPYGHNTLEFRIHDGAIDPILIKAWLNFINRLVDISVAQVQNQDFDPLPDIEHLVYILIAERDYAKTWDKAWGAPISAYIDPSDTDLQLQIQDSVLYQMFLLAKQGQDFASHAGFAKLPPAEQKLILRDLEAMLDLISKFPGITDLPLDQQNIAHCFKLLHAQLTAVEQPVAVRSYGLAAG
jgi:hypothetical protein